MSGINTNSALAATFLSISILFVFGSVHTIFNNFSNHLINNIPYGVSLIVLSIFTLLIGITSPSVQKTLATSILLCIAAVWKSVGISYVWRGIAASTNLTTQVFSDVELYLTGYSSYVLVFIVLLIGSLAHKDFKLGAVISIICIVLYIFEIINLWVDIGGTEIIYILLAVIALYFWLIHTKQNFLSSNTVVPSDNKPLNPKHTPKTQDFIIIWYAMNVVSFSIFAWHITSVTEKPSASFSWCLTSGLFQVVMGISALRRHDPHGASHIILHGIFWLSISFSLFIQLILDNGDSLPIPVLSVFMAAFFALAAIEVAVEIFRTVYYIIFALFTLSLCVDGTQGTFVGGMAWLGLVSSMYGLSAYITRVAETSKKLPLGKLIFEKERVKAALRKFRKKKISMTLSIEGSNKDLFSYDSMLGYSKYVTMESIGFASNAIAALSIVWVQSDYLLIPWAVGVGGVLQFASGFVCFSRGLTFESLSFLIYASFWSIWGFVRGLGFLSPNEGGAIIIGCISYLIAGVVLLALSTVVSKVWSIVSLLFDLLVLGFLLRGTYAMSTDIFEIVVSILFALICLYASLSSTFKNAWGREILPMGRPSIQVSKLHSQGSKAVWANGRRATGVKKIAEILNAGGICGIPTDTVYCLVAACNQPQAVERAYNTKKLAEDRPMSVWISNTNQLSDAREALGDLTWDFMHELWPSNVSLVLRKGDWINCLGLGHAEKYIGRPDSIAIRIPDSSITCHLIDQTGPIALTSANPTGEADTTHHLQVLAKLGIDNCDGILCDGPSRENAASTVVDCRNIHEGKLGFFRIGLTPKSSVEEIFERVKQRHSVSGHVGDMSGKSIDQGYHSSTKDVVQPLNVSLLENMSSSSSSIGEKAKSQVDSYNSIGGQPLRDKSSVQNPVFSKAA